MKNRNRAILGAATSAPSVRAPSQVLMSSEELERKIHGLKQGYENARQTQVKIYTDAHFSSKSLEERRTTKDIFIGVMDKLTSEFTFVEDQLFAQERFHNEFYLTNLKFKALRSKYYLLTKPYGELIRKELTATIGTLKRISTVKT